MYEDIIEALKPYLAQGVKIYARRLHGDVYIVLEQGTARLELYAEGDDCASIQHLTSYNWEEKRNG